MNNKMYMLISTYHDNENLTKNQSDTKKLHSTQNYIIFGKNVVLYVKHKIKSIKYQNIKRYWSKQ